MVGNFQLLIEQMHGEYGDGLFVSSVIRCIRLLVLRHPSAFLYLQLLKLLRVALFWCNNSNLGVSGSSYRSWCCWCCCSYLLLKKEAAVEATAGAAHKLLQGAIASAADAAEAVDVAGAAVALSCQDYQCSARLFFSGCIAAVPTMTSVLQLSKFTFTYELRIC